MIGKETSWELLYQEHKKAIVAAGDQYQKYQAFCESTKAIDLSTDNRLLKLALSSNGRPIHKSVLSSRDDDGRCVAHYLALIFGVRGLLGLKQSTLGVLHALDSQGMTPFHYAALSSASLSSQLIAELKLDVFAEDDYGNSPSVVALIVGHTQFDQACDQLTMPANVELRRLHWRVMYQNVEFSDYDVVRKEILSARQSPLMTNLRDENGTSMLHLACLHGRIKMVRFLLECRVNSYARDKYGQTPLQFAMARVNLLKGKGGQEGQSSWHAYLVKHGLVIVDLLLKQSLAHSDDVLHRLLDSEAVKNSKELALILTWKCWRHKQKCQPDYPFTRVPGLSVLDDAIWDNTILKKNTEVIRQEVKALRSSGSDFPYRVEHARTLIFAMKECLVACANSSFFVSVQYKYGVYANLYNKIMVSLTVMADVNKAGLEGEWLSIMTNFNKEPYHTLQNCFFKGPVGVIRQIKQVVFESNDLPYCMLMEWAVLMQRIVKKAAEVDKELSDFSGYLLSMKSMTE